MGSVVLTPPCASLRRITAGEALEPTAIEQLGMPPISFVGHSIGVNLHERPYLGPHATETLEAGMVLGMEPLVYRSGHGFGMQIKDMVAVEEDGCHLLSDVTDTDELFRIEA